MESPVQAPKAGTIGSITVQQGDSVQNGDELLEII
jgi:biotin carboxyl carrier protein